MDGWKMTVPIGKAYFQGICQVHRGQSSSCKMPVWPVFFGEDVGMSRDKPSVKQFGPWKTLEKQSSNDRKFWLFRVYSGLYCSVMWGLFHKPWNKDPHETMSTSRAARGGGGSFKNRKCIGEIGCCESRMTKRKHWWIWLTAELSNWLTD